MADGKKRKKNRIADQGAAKEPITAAMPPQFCKPTNIVKLKTPDADWSDPRTDLFREFARVCQGLGIPEEKYQRLHAGVVLVRVIRIELDPTALSDPKRLKRYHQQLDAEIAKGRAEIEPYLKPYLKAGLLPPPPKSSRRRDVPQDLKLEWCALYHCEGWRIVDLHSRHNPTNVTESAIRAAIQKVSGVLELPWPRKKET
jgi:hypothetical protein